MDMEDLSNEVCDVMQGHVGTPECVAIRRRSYDIFCTVCESTTLHEFKISLIKGGSRGEGFRIHQSDQDTMVVFENWRVISKYQSYVSPKHERLTMNCSTSPPGYCLLEISTNSTSHFFNSKKTINGKTVLSSSAWNFTFYSNFPLFHMNGPCGRMSYRGCETDAVVGCISDLWPPAASAFRKRHASWPANQTLNDIVSKGCHFVPIGHKLSDHVDDEWRISFCVAEKILVYSLSYCEFLLYGLLKLVLTEMINKNVAEEDKLLSSYHIKTSVFWVLQQSSLPTCCPWNLLQYFWDCFKLILKWVYHGVFPNFFIPENNMFLTKVYGSAQKQLFSKLHELYEKGLSGLICDLLRTSNTIMKFDFEIRELFDELEGFNLPVVQFHQCFDYLRAIENLATKPLPQIDDIIVQTVRASCMNHLAFIVSLFNKGVNRSDYMLDKMACHLLSLSADIGSVSDVLFSAMYYYKTGRYTRSLFLLNKARVTLTQPFNLAFEKEDDIPLFKKSTEDMSLRKIVKACFVFTIKLHNAVPYINELHLEQQSSKMLPFRSVYLKMPPIVLLFMLEFLCYHHVNNERAPVVLNFLVAFVHIYSGRYKDIVWEILGICQQLSGNLHEALVAYVQSFNEHPDNNIGAASFSRIKDVLDHMEKEHNESVCSV